jgi:hypothetical protein
MASFAPDRTRKLRLRRSQHMDAELHAFAKLLMQARLAYAQTMMGDTD